MNMTNQESLRSDNLQTYRNQLIRFSLLALAILGVCITGLMVADHDGPWKVDGSEAGILLQICESASIPSVRCADVVGSRWGSFDFYLGARRILVPTSFVGLVYFVALSAWLWIVGPFYQTMRWYRRGVVALVTLALCCSLFFIFQMAFHLSKWCPLCVVVHIINALIFAGILLSNKLRHQTCATTSEAVTEHRLRRLQHRMVVSALTMAFVVSAGLWMYYQASKEVKHYWRKAQGYKLAMERLQEDEAMVMREFYAQPVVDLPVKYAISSEDESPQDHRLVVFMNYNSSSSACFEKEWKEKYGPVVTHLPRIEYRYLPYINNDHTSLTPEQQDAVRACYAAEVAQLHGDEYARAMMHFLLFRHRKAQGGRDYTRFAKKIGMDEQTFHQLWTSEAVRKSVENDIALANQLGVTSAPTVFLNNRRVPLLCLKSEVFWRAVTRERPATMEVALTHHLSTESVEKDSYVEAHQHD